MIMMITKSTGSGTVTQTMYEELLTPLKTQRKMMIHTPRVPRNAGTENVTGDSSLYYLQFSS